MATIITVSARQVRSGTVTTGARNIPAGSTGSIMLRFDIAEPDLSDPAKTATLTIQRRANAQAPWLAWVAMSWQGGPATKPGGQRQPAVGGNVAEVAGQQVRLIAALSQSLNTGLVIELP